MSDFELDDRFWFDALTAMRSGSTAASLAGSHPEFAQLAKELESDASRDAIVVGFRMAGEGANPRLLAFVAAAFFARGGVRTLLIDLSPDFQWLERVSGVDLKEGLVDHFRYGVSLEKCVAQTALGNLSVLTAGAAMNGGSPVADPTALRSALDRMRQHYGVIVFAIPDRGGEEEVAWGMCDKVVAVQAQDGDLARREADRCVIHVIGDPSAAEDLSRLSRRFLGPLPAILGGTDQARSIDAILFEPNPFHAMVREATESGRAVSEEGVSEEAEDDVAFLESFEASAPTFEDEADLDPKLKDLRATMHRRRLANAVPPPRRRWIATAALAAAVLVGGVFAGRRLAPALAEWWGDSPPVERLVAQLDVESGANGDADVESGPGAVVPLGEAPALDVDGSATADDEPETDGAEGADTSAEAPATAPTAEPPTVGPTSPTPFSIHAGSYRSARTARRVVARLEVAGYTAFVTPVELAERGRWYRVHAGAFADSSAAATARESLLNRGVVDDAIVRATPWSFEMGRYATRDEARARQRDLASRGISTYMLGDEPYTVYAGAFGDSEEATSMRGVLEEAAEPISFIRRHQ